jgi:hypothetical protein
MEWIEVTEDGKMPEMELNSPATEEVWIRTDNPYASRYGIGYRDYELADWSYQGCTGGFKVTHWAKIEPPEGLTW